MNLDKFEDESMFEDEGADKLEALEETNQCSPHERRLFRRSTDLTHVTKPQYDTTGRDTYTKACDLLNVIPAQYFLSRITQREIDLSHRGLGPTGIRAIVIAMLRNTCITKMNVKDNALGMEGAKCLHVMFEQNYFVDDLDVAQNNIGIKGAEYFANTLSYSNTLKKLDLSSKFSERFNFSYCQRWESGGGWGGGGTHEYSRITTLVVSCSSQGHAIFRHRTP